MLAEKLKVANEKHPYIAPFRNQASLLQKEINHILLKLEGVMYGVKQIEARLEEIARGSSEFRKKLSDVTEIVKNQLASIGSCNTSILTPFAFK